MNLSRTKPNKMRYLILVLVCFTVIPIGAQSKASLFHEGRKRSWLIHVPENYSQSNKYPLLIVLHGGGGTAKQIQRNTRSRFNELADQEGFIVVYPQGIRKSWNDNPERDQNGYARKHNIDDVGFINKMILKLEADYNIVEGAIFACGISNGGLMSQTLAMELPSKIKAIGMVASNFGKHQIDKFAGGTQPFPIIFIHGVDDPLFPYDEGVIGVFNKPRGPVLGIEKSVSYMLELNGNTSEPLITPLPNPSTDGCDAEYYSYPNPRNPLLKVELIKVNGGGHTWPGATEQRLISRIVGPTTQDFSASDKLWNFFSSLID